MTHIAGEIALFRTNGPSFYARGSAHRLFVDDRLFLVRKGRLTSMSFNTAVQKVFNFSVACLLIWLSFRYL